MFFLNRVAWDVLFLLCVASAGLCLEIFWRRDSEMTIRDRVNGFIFWPFLITGQAACSLAFYWFVAGQLGAQPLLTVPAWMPGPIQIALAILSTDFLYYWYHRIQHQFLWRFHSVHHSIENLSSVNTYHHWIEPLLMMTIYALPAFLLSVKPTVGLFWIFWIFKAQTYIVHSPTRLHLGPLSKVLLDNRFHRIHHSLEPRHFEKNFGMITPLWDVLFGTAYWPQKNEWPAVGLAGNPEPRNLKQWFIWRLAYPQSSGQTRKSFRQLGSPLFRGL